MPAVPNGVLGIKRRVLLEKQTLARVIETVTPFRQCSRAEIVLVLTILLKMKKNPGRCSCYKLHMVDLFSLSYSNRKLTMNVPNM